MKKILLFLSLLGVLFVSCDRDAEEPGVQEKSESICTTQMTREQAITVAENALTQLIGLASTPRCSLGIGTPKLEAVRNLSKQQSNRSGEILPDTLFYIVNFGDGEGFVMLGGDTRNPTVFAISESGCLSSADTIHNQGLGLYFDHVTSEYQASLMGIGIDNPQPPDLGFTKTPKIFVSPRLGYSQSHWHQGMPYSEAMPNESYGPKCMVGCGALSVATMMSYYKYPSSFSGRSLDWNSINQGAANGTLSSFMAYLGTSQNLNINYGARLSSCQASRVSLTIKNCGFEDPGDFSAFTSSKACSALSNGVIIMNGKREDRSQHPYTYAEHLWVIDGYMKYYITGSIVVSPTYSEPYFHCVWGSGPKYGAETCKGGAANGYYLWSDRFALTADSYGSYDDNKETFDTPYDKDIYMLGNFKHK